MSLVLVFVDGVGVPRNGSGPLRATRDGLFARVEEGGVRPVPGGGVARAIDAVLGVDGLPQSATGQTAILAGVNAPALIGRHAPGFPGPTLRRALKERSVLKAVVDKGLRARFANGFRPAFWSLPEETRWRLSATTVANLAAGLPFTTLFDVVRGEGVYHDVTNAGLRRRGFAVPERAPEDAGAVIARVASENDFVLFEYFETDRAGHDAQLERAIRAVEVIERTILSTVERVGVGDTVVVVSDHGNVEDLSVGGHTRNAVPLIAYGAKARELVDGVRDISQVRDAVLSLLDV